MYWVKLLYTVCVCMYMSRICTQYYSLHSKLYWLRGNAMVPLSRVAAGVMTFVVCYMSVEISAKTLLPLCVYFQIPACWVLSWSLRGQGLKDFCLLVSDVAASCQLSLFRHAALLSISVGHWSESLCLSASQPVLLHPVLLSVSVGHWSESLCLSASQPVLLHPVLLSVSVWHWSESLYLSASQPVLLHPVLLSVSVGHWSESPCLSASQPVRLHPVLLSVSVGHWFESLCLSASQPSFFNQCYSACLLDTGPNLCSTMMCTTNRLISIHCVCVWVKWNGC